MVQKEKACIDSFFKMLEENQYKIQYRVMLARYRGKTLCPMCHGTRLKKEAGYVKSKRTLYIRIGRFIHS